MSDRISCRNQVSLGVVSVPGRIRCTPARRNVIARQNVLVKNGRVSSQFYSLSHQRFRVHAVNEVSAALVSSLLRSPEQLLHDCDTQVVKRGRTSLVARCTLPLTTGPASVAFKRSRRYNWIKILTGLFRENRARRNWRIGHAMLGRGIPAPRPLVAIVPRFPGASRECFLILEWLDGAVSLAQRLAAESRSACPRRQRRLDALAHSLGTAIGRMHRHGFFHRDLNAGNVMVRERDGQVETFLIDLDAAGVSWFPRRAERLCNLARLMIDVECADCMRASHCVHFLRAYLAELDDGCWSLRTIWNELRDSAEALKRDRQRRKESRLPRRVLTPADSM